MKRLFLLLTIILSFGLMHAQETYRFRTNAPQGFSIENSTETNLSLHYAITELGITNIDNGEAKGQEIVLKGSFGSFAEGLPNLPYENRYIAIPSGATVSIEVKELGCQTLSDIEVLPAANMQENGTIGLPKLRKDTSVYGKDTFFPTENVAIAQTTQIRGLDVALLSVTPFRYNPVRKTLEVIYDMDIEVRFEGGNGEFGEARYRNPDWDHILRDLVINGDMLPEAHYYDLLNEAIRSKEEGCEYLIIAPDDDSILAWADTLKQFRTRQGILTKVVTTTECGGNEPETIKSYILNAYNNWAIPPAALMIFGGCQDSLDYYDDFEHPANDVITKGIPGFSLVFLGYSDENPVEYYVSDNPYADMNGDSIPDMAISRMTALTLEEYQIQVEKLIHFETNPPTDLLYYDHPIITSAYENMTWFMITSQSVNGFYCNKLGRHPSNLYSIYYYYAYSHPNPPDSTWSDAPYADVAVSYFGPEGENYIPSSIGELDNWIDYEDYQLLLDAFNKGSFLTMFRGHSSNYSWGSQDFYFTDIHTLQNQDPTFVLSIGCHTALYVETIENYGVYGQYFMPRGLLSEFCDARVGALGGIGAVSVTRSRFNDILTWGLLDYIWPEFMSTLGSSTYPDFVRPAYALIAGKLFLNQHAFIPGWWPGHITDTHNVFHYLGDAYLNLYTEIPQQIDHDFVPFITHGQCQYEFTVEEGAVVCFSKNNEIIQVVQGTGQSQSVTLPEMTIGERFTITATKQNRFRHQQTVKIIPSTQSYIYVKQADFKDLLGDHQLDYGENVTIDLTLCNAGLFASQNATIQLFSDSPYVEILEGTAAYPIIEPNAEHIVHNAFRIRLSNDVPDQTTLRFQVQFDEGLNTHFDVITAKANAPVICIEPEFRPMAADDEPSTHIATEGKSKIAFTVTNKGHSSTALLSANLAVKAPFVEVENPQLQIESLAPNDTCTFTYELYTLPNTISGAWLQSKLDIQHEASHICLDTIIQYGGIFENFESDTLNPLLQWANQGSHSWVYCDEDAYEGNRCFMSRADLGTQSALALRLKAPSIVMHGCKVSFRYKTDQAEQLRFQLVNKYDVYLSSTEWTYAEFHCRDADDSTIKFFYSKNDTISEQAKIDNLCFPPKHTAIAYAGDDLIACGESSVELIHAYAYDCNSVVWTSEGDGHFDCDTIANPTYFPGSQDLANGSVTLSLSAFGNDTIVSSTQIQFIDEISLSTIVGDTVVNKYSNPVSHYSVESQEGINYLWQLEPTEAGIVYDYGNEMDILWNLNEGDAEVTISVTADNGCDVEPVTKTISLIGYDTPEWHAADFDLFPNPTDGKVNLVVGETLQGKALVEVYNLLGERMMAKTFHHLQRGETLGLDLSGFVSGLYIIKLSTEKGSCSKKVSVR